MDYSKFENSGKGKKENRTSCYIHNVVQSFICKWKMLKLYYNIFRKRSDETPLPTPTYKHNTWMKNQRRIPYTPKSDEKGNQIFKFALL